MTSIVGATVYERLEKLAPLVAAENEAQNLISRSTVSAMWSRHILDSVQLLRWRGAATSAPWVDVGTGGGFPGLAVAAAIDGPVTLVEPRRLRARFLTDAAASLGLRNVTVLPAKVETVERSASIVSARAVAPIEKLLRAAGHCATPATRWLLLRGQPQAGELESLEATFDMVFHVEHSLTDPASVVVIATGRPAA